MRTDLYLCPYQVSEVIQRLLFALSVRLRHSPCDVVVTIRYCNILQRIAPSVGYPLPINCITQYKQQNHLEEITHLGNITSVQNVAPCRRRRYSNF